MILFGNYFYKSHLLASESSSKKKEKFPQITNLYNAPKDIDSYFDYHFPFKKFILRFGNSIQYYFFNLSTTKKIILGKDGWLFNGDDFPEIAKGKLLYSDDELNNIKDFFEKREHFFKSKNINYILLIVPDKESIYPEKYSIKYQPLANYTRYDQLVDYLKNNTSIEVIYPKDYVRNACKESPQLCYFKLDSHWNDIGAFYGYQAIFKVLLKYYPNIIEPKLSDFVIRHYKDDRGFVRMLGIYNAKSITDSAPFLVFKNAKDIGYKPDIRTSAQLEGTSIRKVREYKNLLLNNDNSIPKVVIWGDSFSVRLNKYFVYNAKETINVNKKDKFFDMESVAQYQPSLVVDEFLARMISSMDFKN